MLNIYLWNVGGQKSSVETNSIKTLSKLYNVLEKLQNMLNIIIHYHLHRRHAHFLHHIRHNHDHHCRYCHRHHHRRIVCVIFGWWYLAVMLARGFQPIKNGLHFTVSDLLVTIIVTLRWTSCGPGTGLQAHPLKLIYRFTPSQENYIYDRILPWITRKLRIW